jgi:hypothetical protein
MDELSGSAAIGTHQPVTRATCAGSGGRLGSRAGRPMTDGLRDRDTSLPSDTRKVHAGAATSKASVRLSRPKGMDSAVIVPA